MSIYKFDMLLFCKQIQKGQGLVYCVEMDTLDDISPRVHRFHVSLPRFLKMELGNVYRFEVMGIRIIKMIFEGVCELSESDYELLQELRFRRFEGKPREEFDIRHYFTFGEMRSLMNYHEPLLTRFLLYLLRMLAFALSGLIPITLYGLLIFACFSDSKSALSGLYISLGALPFMIYLVLLLYSVTEMLLLEWRQTRYGMLRSSALRGCGIKRKLGIDRNQARRLVYFGAVSFGVFFLSSLLTLLL